MKRMNLLIKNARILDSSSAYHKQTVCIRITDGKITELGENLHTKDHEKEVNFENLLVSPGWFDSSVSMGEPGFEERETIDNGLKVAAKSGFTAVALNPNTNPVIDSQADVRFIKNKATGQAVDVLPIAALTKNSDGIDLAELYDMTQAGAVAFGDYKIPVENPNLLKIALQYTQGFDGLVLSYPMEKNLTGKGQMNEGTVSTNLGLKGIPALSESLQIARDLHVLEYAGGKLHIPTISTEASVQLIRDAKKRGLDVSCSVAIAHLMLTEERLAEFDTRFKMLPPLRTEKDRKALIAGVEDGTVDMVCSDHNPLDIELKKLEFDHAAFGTIAQEITFKALLKLFGTEKTVELLNQGKARFGISANIIAEGEVANLSLFTDQGTSVYGKNNILSKSKNSAFLDMEFSGQVYGIVANQHLVI
ncbi:MAG: dihydroorotase [Leeuwenhoekiella sp.]